jgi:superfamily II DNA or RNA helicase
MSQDSPFARLPELLANSFDVSSRVRGDDDFHAGRVQIESVGPTFARASVRDKHGMHQTSFVADASLVWRPECSCAIGASGGRCEHLWAVLLGVDRAGWRAEGARRDSLSGGRLVRLGEWRARLAEIRSRKMPVDTAPLAVRLNYVVRLDRGGAGGSGMGGGGTDEGVVLETRRSTPRKSGAWSRFAPFAPLAEPIEARMRAEDRRVLDLLRSATPFESDDDSLLSARQFLLSAELAGVLLPLIAEAGALHWAKLGRESQGALRLDSDPPWDVERAIHEEPGAAELIVTCRLARGSERETLGAVLGVLAGGWVVFADKLGKLENAGDTAWLRSLMEQGPLRVPAEDRSELLREISRGDERFVIEGRFESARHDIAPRPRLTLDAPDLARDGAVELTGEVMFEYEGALVAADDPRPFIERREGWIARQSDTESARLRRPFELGARALSERPGAVIVPLDLVADLARELTLEGWLVEGDGSRYRAASGARWSVRSGIDWFDLDGQIAFGAASAAVPRLVAALQRRERTVVLDDGAIGVLPQEWLARFETLSSLGDASGNALRFRTNQAWLVEALLAEGSDLGADDRFREQLAGLSRFRAIESTQEPPDFVGELRPYQREGLGWLEFLERQHFGGCLADDMGLGKTVQLLAWLLARRARMETPAPTLVVAPKSLTHNWISETHRFAPSLRVLDYTGASRRTLAEQIAGNDLIVTTYGTLRNDIDVLSQARFDCVVLDEAQAIKNADTLTAKAARLLQANHRLALSGTPIENHLGELWSLFEFLNPGMLGRSTLFARLTEAQRDETAERQSRELLARAVRPFVLRRTKEQVLRDLPPKTEQTILCELDPSARREYDELRDHYRRALLHEPGGAKPDSFVVLEALLRLRQAACHPGLIDPSRVDEPSPKLEALFESLDEVIDAGHKALVFSQFTSFLAIVRERVRQRGLGYAYLDGGTSAKARVEEIRRFQSEPNCSLFLLSLKAGGVGLNLTAADYVFLLDPWWNPAVEAQAIGRSHRIGQTRSVFAYKLVCADTVEERVLELQARKRELASVLLDGEATTLRDLTRDDIERLLA